MVNNSTLTTHLKQAMCLGEDTAAHEFGDILWLILHMAY